MKIICFSSYQSVWFFAFAEAVVAFELQKRGHDVLFITPGNQLVERSNLMNENILKKQFNLNGYEIGKVITEEDKKEIDSLIKSLNKNNFENLIIDDVNIGKIALYEILLHRKKMNLNFTQDEWAECLVELKDTLVSFFACRRIINNEKPDIVLMYNTLYSVNHVWERYANLKGISVYFIHHGVNLSDMDNTLIIAKNNSMHYISKLKNIWFKLKDIPIPMKMICFVTDHFLELLKAKHYLVYSSPKSMGAINIRNFFNIKNNQKILTATMSSYDEMFAAEYIGVRHRPDNLIFISQTEWIKALIGYMKDRPDLFLIIRVHPREFPNKRDSVKSEHSKILENTFNKLPNNIKINWPTDNISMYDLAQETDVFLNSWSSVGVEMSLLGIPVVIYSKELIAYPPDLNYVAKDKDDYLDKIELALKEGWSYERIKYTYRWLALNYYRPIIRLRDKKIKPEIKKNDNSISDKLYYFYNLLPIPRQVKLFLRKTKEKQKLIRDCAVQLTEKIDISRVEKMLAEKGNTLIDVEGILATKISDEEENRFIRAEIKRLYEALYGHQGNGAEIKTNSLQYNLKKII